MIQIIVRSTGVELALAPDTEFQIDIEQPLLDSERIPTPFSTSIHLPPTTSNCQQLGYLAAMMLEPSVKSLDVDLFISGILIMSGMLQYDSIEDGDMVYTFVGKSVADDWSTPLNELDLKVVDCTTRNTNIAYYLAGVDGDVFCPPMINASNASDPVNVNDVKESVETYIKYHNDPLTSRPFFTPAIRVPFLLQGAFGSVTIDTELETAIHDVAIIGQYKPEGQYNGSGFPNHDFYATETLPSITLRELAQGLAKMFCSAFFRDGDKFKLLPASAVLDGSAAASVDWDSKLTDVWGSRIEPAKEYTFGYGNEEDENAYDQSDLSSDIQSGDILVKSNLIDIVTQHSGSDYESSTHTVTKDIYSSRPLAAKSTTGNYTLALALTDMVFHKLDKIEVKPEDSSEDSLDNSVPFELVRCVPDRRSDVVSGQLRTINFMAPLINAPSIGDENGTQVYIGIVKLVISQDEQTYQQQMADKGRMISVESGHADVTVPSLDPATLVTNWHQDFIDFITKSHQCVTVDLKLSLSDIMDFRMYRKVYFKGREWLCKKLSLTFRTGTDNVDASGEFISL